MRTLTAPGSGTIRRKSAALVAGGLLVASALVAVPASAEVMRAGTGQPLFYPCTSCHPVDPATGTRADGVKLPNDFKEHKIVLAEHAVLGKGSEACTVCHEDSEKDPGKLKTASGALVDITGDTSAVCYKCHSLIYKEFEAGIHGAGQAKCTASGCHDPHAPGSMYGGYLLPFVGNGFSFAVRPEKKPFTPLPAPAHEAPYETPSWMVTMFISGLVVAGGIAGSIVRGRPKR